MPHRPLVGRAAARPGKEDSWGVCWEMWALTRLSRPLAQCAVHYSGYAGFALAVTRRYPINPSHRQ